MPAFCYSTELNSKINERINEYKISCIVFFASCKYFKSSIGLCSEKLCVVVTVPVSVPPFVSDSPEVVFTFGVLIASATLSPIGAFSVSPVIVSPRVPDLVRLRVSVVASSFILCNDITGASEILYLHMRRDTRKQTQYFQLGSSNYNRELKNKFQDYPKVFLQLPRRRHSCRLQQILFVKASRLKNHFLYTPLSDMSPFSVTSVLSSYLVSSCIGSGNITRFFSTDNDTPNFALHRSQKLVLC
jgi:hypothetical protein